MSNLTPIDIEKALELSLAAPPVPKQGPVETALRAALAMLGPNGERWIKGAASQRVGAQRMLITKPLRACNFVVGPDGAAETTAMCYDIIELGEHAYCSIGAMDAALRNRSFVCLDALEAAFCFANGIEDIPMWNDAPRRTFAEVKAAFERAIVYAHGGM